MKELPPSATLTVSAKAKKKKKEGIHVHNFAAGDPSLKNHPAILEAVTREVSKGLSPYPPIPGFLKLRECLSSWINEKCQTNFSAEQVLVTAGGKFAIFAVLHQFINHGEEVLFSAPYWVSYPPITEMVGGIPKVIDTKPENGWKMTAEDLLNAATPKSKFLIINNGNNPTGMLYSRKEVNDLLDTAAELDLTVISDEVYSGLTFGEVEFVSFASFPEHAERVIVIQSCSKNFAMAGWRVGFVLAQEPVIKRLSTYQSQTITALPLASQWAALGALENASLVNGYVKTEMLQRRDLFVETYNALFPQPITPPPSALYTFLSLKELGVQTEISSIEFCEQLIEQHNIALVPGEAFGVPGYVRLAYSESKDEIVQGLKVLAVAVQK